MKNRLLLILNPCAGVKKANRLLPEIIRIYNDHEYDCVVYVTNAAGDAEVHIREMTEHYDRIVCIGGDGTLNETIAGVTRGGIDTPVGYIPAGSTNDFARSLGISPDIMAACVDSVEGEPFEFDLGQFNGRYFNYTASCGAFAKASYSTSQAAKNALGHLAYIMGGICDIHNIHPIHMTFDTGDKNYENDYIFCSITNSLSVGGIIKLDPEMVCLNDGLFEVMLVHYPRSPIELTRILSAMNNFDMSSDLIDFFTASKIKITSGEDLEWTLDGERGDTGREFEAVNLWRKMKLILPKRSVDALPAEAEDPSETDQQ